LKKYTYTNGVTTRNQKKNKKRNVFMERWNELERCRDPIVMCSAKIVNRAVYELIDIAAHKEKTI